MLHKDNSIDRFERLPLEESIGINDMRVLEYDNMNVVLMKDLISYTETHDLQDTLNHLYMDTKYKDIGILINEDSLYYNDGVYDYISYIYESLNLPIYILSDNVEQSRLDRLIQEAIEYEDPDRLDVFIEEQSDEDIKNDLKDAMIAELGKKNMSNATIEKAKKAAKGRIDEYKEKAKEHLKKNWKKNTAIAAFGAYGAHKIFKKANAIHKKYDPYARGIIQKRIDILKHKLGIMKKSPVAQKNPGLIRRIMNKIRELISRLRGKQQS